jgi:hypothetical protein
MKLYRRWLRKRIRQRRHQYHAAADPHLLTLVTPVYNTRPRFLRELARSVFRQDYPWFEWIVVNNGSTSIPTCRVLEELASDPRVRLLHITPNRGIMGGTRVAVAAARGRYVLPVDSDDRLYSDALQVMAAVLQRHSYPALAYSDEDKLLPTGRPDHPFLKPDWDPVLFWNCCYAAHLCAIDREVASELDAYTDDAAHGCHDWDTFWRFVRAGHTPVHVPEVLYSWRMHPESTSTPNTSPKPYTLGSQGHVLHGQLRSRGLDDRLEMRINPLFHRPGMWQVARKPIDPIPLHVAVHGASAVRRQRLLHALAECDYPLLNVHVTRDQGSGAEGAWHEGSRGGDNEVTVHRGLSPLLAPAGRWLQDLPTSALVVILSDVVVPISLDWPWEALGLFELHEDAVVVGGRVLDSTRRVVSAGEIFGLDGIVGTPDWGRCNNDPGHYGLHISQRSVDAVSGEFFIARAGFLRRVLATLPEHLMDTPQLLSAWIGGHARRTGKRVVYSPHIVAQRVVPGDIPASASVDLALFEEHFGDLLEDDRHYSRYHVRDQKCGYQLARRPFGSESMRPLWRRSITSARE